MNDLCPLHFMERACNSRWCIGRRILADFDVELQAYFASQEYATFIWHAWRTRRTA